MAHVSDFTVDAQGGLVGRGFTAGHKYEWELYCAPDITELDQCQVTAMAVQQGAGAVERSLMGKTAQRAELSEGLSEGLSSVDWGTVTDQRTVEGSWGSGVGKKDESGSNPSSYYYQYTLTLPPGQLSRPGGMEEAEASGAGQLSRPGGALSFFDDVTCFFLYNERDCDGWTSRGREGGEAWHN